MNYELYDYEKFICPHIWHPYVSIEENIPKYIERKVSFMT